MSQEQPHLDGAAGADVVAEPIDPAVVGRDPEAAPVAGEKRGEWGESVAFPDVAIGRFPRWVAHLGQECPRREQRQRQCHYHRERSEGGHARYSPPPPHCVRGQGDTPFPDAFPYPHQHSLRSRPVISVGGSSPSSRNTVGATSRREPPARRLAACVPTATNGTGLVVWAVCTPPVAGSIIISLFP